MRHSLDPQPIKMLCCAWMEVIQVTFISLSRQGQAVLGSRKLLDITNPLAEGHILLLWSQSAGLP